MNTATMKLGKPDRTWIDRGVPIYTAPVLFNDKPAYKAIIYRDRLMSIQGLPYVLLPNEEAVRIADDAAAEAGLVPFDEFSGPWIANLQSKNHTISYGRNKAKVHAMYALNQSYQINGETMHIGVSMHNSVDGSMGFGCGCFTFRKACSNMVIVAGRKNWSFYYHAGDHAHTVKAVWKPHRKGLDPFTGHLKTVIVEVMDFAKSIIDSYKIMADQDVTRQLVEKISQRLPQKVLPDYIPKKKELATWDAADIASTTEWELYNDITEQIWHNKEAGIDTKKDQYKALHAVMPIARR